MKKSVGPQTIVYPTPVFIVGSYDPNNNPNVMTAAWGGICCSDPPCVSVSIRKLRKTYDNIIASRAFTINIPSEKFVNEADYYGLVSGKNIDKLSDTNLTAVKSEILNAPYIKEFPIILECSLLHTFEIGIHTQFIGEIKDVKVEENCVSENGDPDIEKIKPIIFSPDNRMYYSIGNNIAKAFNAGKIFKK